MQVVDFCDLFVCLFVCRVLQVPEPATPWNMNFMGVKFSKSMTPQYELGVPKPFYDAQHRPSHFLNFAALEVKREDAPPADREDVFE